MYDRLNFTTAAATFCKIKQRSRLIFTDKTEVRSVAAIIWFPTIQVLGEYDLHHKSQQHSSHNFGTRKPGLYPPGASPT
jgi:hypothetical protein